MESRIQAESIYLENSNPGGVLVSFHANDEEPPLKVIPALNFDQAADVARGILEESPSAYCARIWHCGIPVESIYRAGGILFCFNVLKQLSREEAEREAKAELANHESD